MDNLRKERLSPALLNPNQAAVKPYDAFAEIFDNTVKASSEMLNAYAKSEDYRQEKETDATISTYEQRAEHAKKEILLGENHQNFEEEYQKRIAKLDEEFNDTIPERYRNRFQKYTGLAKEKGILDIRYEATKKSQQQANESLVESISKMAGLSVGKSQQDIHLYNARVLSGVNEAVNAGRISPIQREKLLSSYEKAKTEGNIRHLILTNPEKAEAILKNNEWGFDQEKLDSFRISAQTELAKRQIRFDFALKAEEEAHINTALGYLSQRKDIPLETMSKLSPSVQQAINIRQEYMITGQDIPTDENAYDFLQIMARNNPERFKAVNLNEYMGSLSLPDLTTFKYMQDSIVINKKGKAKTDPKVQFESDLKNMAYERMGYKKTDVEKKYYFNQMYEDEARALIQEKKRDLTSREKEAIVNQLTKDISLKNKWLSGKRKVSELTDEDKAYDPVLIDNKLNVTREQMASIVSGISSYGLSVTDLNADEQIEWLGALNAAYQSPIAIRQNRVQSVLDELSTYIKNR